jgi:hypothetical protein
MGYTHFDKVSGINGVAVGAKGAEVSLSEKNATVVFTFGTASAAETQMAVAPITGNIVAAYAVNQVVSVAGTYTAKLGSAGTTIVSGTQAAPSVAIETASLTIDSAAVTAGSALSCVRAASGTTGASQVVLVLTKTA